VPGYSTTSLIDRIRGAADARGARAVDVDDDALTSALRDHLEVTSALLGECVPAIRRAGKRIAGALRAGSRLFVFGDGESSVDAQHIASSIARRVERPESVVGSRAGGGDLAGVPRAGDVAVALSTGGDPRGVLATVMTARERGCVTIGLTGAAGKRLASLCDVAVLVPSDHVPRIREAHVVIGHLWSELLRA
jgi:D-sedoheptulose 7-phosphate isomerase